MFLYWIIVFYLILALAQNIRLRNCIDIAGYDKGMIINMNVNGGYIYRHFCVGAAAMSRPKVLITRADIPQKALDMLNEK